MTTETTLQPTTDPPVDEPITRAEFDQLRRTLAGIEARCVRTETRVTRLLEHHGLNTHGLPSVTTEEN